MKGSFACLYWILCKGVGGLEIFFPMEPSFINPTLYGLRDVRVLMWGVGVSRTLTLHDIRYFLVDLTWPWKKHLWYFYEFKSLINSPGI